MTTNTIKDDKDKKEEDEEDGEEDCEEDYDEDDEDDYDEDKEDDEDYEEEESEESEEINDVYSPEGGYFNKYAEANDDDNNKKDKVFLILKRLSQNSKLIKKTKYNFYKKYNNDEKKYFDALSEKEKDDIQILEEQLTTNKSSLAVPMRFKILDLNINERTKRSIIYKLECLNMMSSTSGEYHKINNWLNVLNNVPFNKYYNIPTATRRYVRF